MRPWWDMHRHLQVSVTGITAPKSWRAWYCWFVWAIQQDIYWGMVDRAWSWTRSEVRPILTSGYDWFLHSKIKCRRERGLNGWDGSVYASDFRCLTTANSWQGCQLSASCQVDDVCQVPSPKSILLDKGDYTAIPMEGRGLQLLRPEILPGVQNSLLFEEPLFIMMRWQGD